MNSMVGFLRFTGEEASMFEDNVLPTLDTALWVEGDVIKYRFYEKPTVGNRVLLNTTALPESCIKSSLLQECVRRLQNCSRDLGPELVVNILNKFAYKLINSGYRNQEARVLLVQGLTKYNDLLRRDNLPVNHKKYRPMYLRKEFRESERQLEKYMQKMCWFENDNKTLGAKWRDSLSGFWRGSPPLQKRAKGMMYTSMMQVQNSKDGRLLKELVKLEPKVAKATGYNIKLCEKSGIQTIRFFNRIIMPDMMKVVKCV